MEYFSKYINDINRICNTYTKFIKSNLQKNLQNQELINKYNQGNTELLQYLIINNLLTQNKPTSALLSLCLLYMLYEQKLQVVKYHQILNTPNIFPLFTLIQCTTSEYTGLADIYKEHNYKVFSNVRTILSREAVKKEYRTTKVLIQFITGLAIDLENNIIYMCPNLIGESKSTKQLHECLAFLNWEKDTELLNKINNILEKINNFNYEYATENIINNIIKQIEEKYKCFMLINIQQRIFEKKVDQMKRKVDDMTYRVREMLNQYSIALDEKQRLEQQLLNKTSLFKNLDVTNALSSYINNKLIKDVTYADLANPTLRIVWNPLPITYLDTDVLRKHYRNITSDQERLAALDKVIEGKASLYTASLITDITFGTNKLTFKTLINPSNKIFDDRMNSSGRELYCNKHPLYNDGSGCRGTFGPKMEELQIEYNFKGLLTIISQYYQSITIGDPLGNRAIKSMIIVDDETGDIIHKGIDHSYTTRINNIKEAM